MITWIYITCNDIIDVVININCNNIIYLIFVIPFANAVVAVVFAVVAKLNTEFAVILVSPNVIPNPDVSL